MRGGRLNLEFEMVRWEKWKRDMVLRSKFWKILEFKVYVRDEVNVSKREVLFESLYKEYLGFGSYFYFTLSDNFFFLIFDIGDKGFLFWLCFFWRNLIRRTFFVL